MGEFSWNKNAMSKETQMPIKKLYFNVLLNDKGCNLVSSRMPNKKKMSTKAKEAIPKPLYINT